MTSRGSAYITGTSSFLPNAPIANDDIEQVLGVIGGKPSRARRIVLRNNGIRSRHYAIDPVSGEFTHSNAQLTAEAIRGLEAGGIDVLACGTSCPDQLMPSHAVMVHGELAIPPCEVVSTAGICAAGIGALKYAYMTVLTGLADKAVASGSERASGGLLARHYEPESAHRVAELEDNPEIAFEKDFLRWMLSDGAGAFLLQPAPRSEGLSLRIDWIDIQSQADSMPVCMYAGGDKADDGSLKGWQEYAASQWGERSIFSVKQDVRLLNEAIVEQTFGKPLAKAQASRGLTAEAVDWFLPHMSSEYFRQPLANYMTQAGFELPQAKWFTNLQSKGNTGSASIFIMLDELFRSNRLKAGDRLLCFVPESGRFTGSLMHLTAVDHAG
uniref:Beta-ketoacyl-[acyl-carrier-protein] synthase III C-terminal domain-containing protein n=1 Tax=Dechloromonas aromatica (strain RCB) TaxID=159087 RepID=Q47DH7_DECAR